MGTLLLLQAKIDYSNNSIIPGSLQLDNFEPAKFTRYKKHGISQREQLVLIVGNNFDTLMLKHLYLFKHIFQRELQIKLVVPYSY